jgi:hypothetical protein
VAAAAGALAVVAAVLLCSLAEPPAAEAEEDVLPPPPHPAIASAMRPVAPKAPRMPAFDLFMEGSDSVVDVQPKGRLRGEILSVEVWRADPACDDSAQSSEGYR